jgi:hypothetical protein
MRAANVSPVHVLGPSIIFGHGGVLPVSSRLLVATARPRKGQAVGTRSHYLLLMNTYLALITPANRSVIIKPLGDFAMANLLR